MSETTAESIDRPPRVALSCLLLTGALLLVFPLFAFFGYTRHGSMGLVAAAVAGTVCWIGGVASLALVGLFRGQQAAVQGTLLGMLFRTGSPLVVGVMFVQSGGELARSGVFGMILGYYLVALVIDTVLSVWLVSSAKQSLGKAS